MTRPLRRNHFWIWAALSTLLPILFAAGLIVRRSPTPKNPSTHWEKYR